MTDGAPNRLAELQDASHRQTLQDEEVGVRHRILNFYLPLFLAHAQTVGKAPGDMRVLDCGCGNGASAEYLANAGFQGFGIDNAAFRVDQWPERAAMPRVHLVAASATALPFPDRFFDIIFSCGMLEHIGVYEECTPDYKVEPLPAQEEMRRSFLAESMRILQPDGVLFVDHPNGNFPIDFWHNDYRARPRFHSTREKFLPSFVEVSTLAKSVAKGCSVEAISPAGRFTFRRSARRWYGKILTGAVQTYFEMLRYRPFNLLAGTALNPYLVIRITR